MDVERPGRQYRSLGGSWPRPIVSTGPALVCQIEVVHDIVHGLITSSYHVGFFIRVASRHPRPGGALAIIYITLRRYLLIRLQPRLTELELDPTPRATNHRITHRVSRYFTKPIIEYFGRLLDHPTRSQSPSAPA